MRRLSTAGARVTALSDGWTLVTSAAGLYEDPAVALRAGQAVAAPVPGTVAGALRNAGAFDPQHPVALNELDAWYFCDLSAEAPGPAILCFEGLATCAGIYLNDELLLSTESMFETYDVEVELTGRDRLAIAFRALRPHLDRAGPRARWRPRMFDHQGYRLIRTSLLGAMPGWCPSIHPVGPFRPVSILRPGAVRIRDLALHASLEGRNRGRLVLRLRAETDSPPVLACNGQTSQSVDIGDGEWQAELVLHDIRPWWPHSHGEPVLYPVSMRLGGETIDLGHTGFRSVEVDRGADGKGFGLTINGEPVFCRGAVWTTADIVTLGGTGADYLPVLERAVEAGMNMIRIGGTMAYESPAFFACCDRLGLMVWQDFMFANFDYPVKDEGFVAHVRQEAGDLLGPISAAPSLVVLCGGSEIYQQAAMLGLGKTFWAGPLTETLLAECAALLRPDVAYVPNSPFGGSMPFAPNEGVTHYYGVGAYERPLEDARRANVRFSAESLAFAQVPQQRTLDAHLAVAPVHDPRWKERVPRDRDASWDFEDTRDHYLERLYGVDPARLRREDPARYLDFSRAVTGEVSESVFAEWRRPGSNCRGGLVWTLRDLLPGPGWGVIDSTGEPKPVLYALKRAFRPVQLLLVDEGTNGLDIHVLNEKADPLRAVLEIRCLRDGQQPVVTGRRELTLDPRGAVSLAATDLFGAFFDTTYAFRFGPPAHDVTVAILSTPEGDLLAEAFHFPQGRAKAMHPARLEASLVRDAAQWSLLVEADRFAPSVSVVSPTHRAGDDWFHLAPGGRKRVPLIPRPGTDPDALPSGTLQHLGSRQIFPF